MQAVKQGICESRLRYQYRAWPLRDPPHAATREHADWSGCEQEQPVRAHVVVSLKYGSNQRHRFVFVSDINISAGGHLSELPFHPLKVWSAHFTYTQFHSRSFRRHVVLSVSKRECSTR